MFEKEPEVKLTQIFDSPYNNAIATARTCYSAKGIVTAEEVIGTGKPEEEQQRLLALRDSIAKSTFEAGHHTVLQHTHIQFSLQNVSRHFVWSFLHRHQMYNTEQQSQRFCKVKKENVIQPIISYPIIKARYN